MANAYAPAHSRLFRELILVASPDRPFPVSGKGSIRKSQVVKDYEKEIDELYDAQEARANVGVEVPSEWSSEATVDYVRKVVGKVLVQKVQDEDDIFQFGGDRYVNEWC